MDGVSIKPQIANQHVVDKLHLSTRATADALPEVAASLIGFHAARLQSPIVAAATRVEGANAAQLARGLHRSRDLIKLRCMRGTLHIAPLALAPMLHAATLAPRLSVCRAAERRFAIPPKAGRAVAEAVLDCFGGRMLTTEQIHAEIANIVTRRTGLSRTEGVFYLRSQIKTLWETGELCARNLAPDWRKEVRVYAPLGEAYPGLDMRGLSAIDATRALVAAYFKQYGPATVADAAWWSGLGELKIRRTIAEMGERLASVRVEGIASVCYMLAEDYESLSGVRLNPDNVEFLAYEDNLLKGYKESRCRFLIDNKYESVFNRIGEALPTVLVHGRIAGIWHFEKEAGRIRYSLFDDFGAAVEKLVEQRQQRLEDLLSYYRDDALTISDSDANPQTVAGL